MTTKRKGWFIPPTKGLLESVSNPTPHPARDAVASLLWYVPEQEKQKPDDTSPEILAGFKKRL